MASSPPPEAFVSSTILDGRALICRIENDVARLTLHRQDGSLNRFDTHLLAEWEQCTEWLAARQDLRGILLDSEGRVFLAGGDIREFEQRFDLPTPRMASEVRRFQQALVEFAALPLPIACALQATALGGGLEIALTCDHIVAAPTVRMGLPEVTLGILPATGGCLRLGRRIPPAEAARLIASGRLLQGDEAQTLGIVDACATTPREAAQHWLQAPGHWEARRLTRARPARERTDPGFQAWETDYAHAQREALATVLDAALLDAPMALEREIEGLARLAGSDATRQLIRQFISRSG